MFTIIGGDGREYGPATVEQIRGWIAAGRANLETKARAAGAEEWRRLGDFPEFSPQASVPPPMTAGAGGPAMTAAVPLAGGGAMLELADRGTRLGAAVIDRLLSAVVALPGVAMMWPVIMQLIAAGIRGEQPDIEALSTGSFILGILLAGAGWLALFLVQVWLISTRGQSLGKRMLGIRIVKHGDDAKPGFLHGWLLRNFVPGLIGAVPYLGALFVLVNVCFIFGEERRCVHDYIAGTKVVKA
jgi:uncharacterized RDD family membrane protein YckC